MSIFGIVFFRGRIILWGCGSGCGGGGVGGRGVRKLNFRGNSLFFISPLGCA